MTGVVEHAVGGLPGNGRKAMEGGRGGGGRRVLLVHNGWWLAVLVLVADGGEGSAGSGRRWWWRWRRAGGWWVGMADHDKAVMTPGPWASPGTRTLTRTLPVTDGGS